MLREWEHIGAISALGYIPEHTTTRMLEVVSTKFHPDILVQTTIFFSLSTHLRRHVVNAEPYWEIKFQSCLANLHLRNFAPKLIILFFFFLVIYVWQMYFWKEYYIQLPKHKLEK